MSEPKPKGAKLRKKKPVKHLSTFERHDASIPKHAVEVEGERRERQQQVS